MKPPSWPAASRLAGVALGKLLGRTGRLPSLRPSFAHRSGLREGGSTSPARPLRVAGKPAVRSPQATPGKRPESNPARGEWSRRNKPNEQADTAARRSGLSGGRDDGRQELQVRWKLRGDRPHPETVLQGGFLFTCCRNPQITGLIYEVQFVSCLACYRGL